MGGPAGTPTRPLAVCSWVAAPGGGQSPRLGEQGSGCVLTAPQCAGEGGTPPVRTSVFPPALWVSRRPQQSVYEAVALERGTARTTSHLSLGSSVEQLSSSVVSQATPSCLPSSLPRPGSTHIFSVTQRWLMAGARTRLSLPSCRREQTRQRLSGVGRRECWVQGAWERSSELLAVCPTTSSP